MMLTKKNQYLIMYIHCDCIFENQCIIVKRQSETHYWLYVLFWTIINRFHFSYFIFIIFYLYILLFFTMSIVYFIIWKNYTKVMALPPTGFSFPLLPSMHWMGCPQVCRTQVAVRKVYALLPLPPPYKVGERELLQHRIKVVSYLIGSISVTCPSLDQNSCWGKGVCRGASVGFLANLSKA